MSCPYELEAQIEAQFDKNVKEKVELKHKTSDSAQKRTLFRKAHEPSKLNSSSDLKKNVKSINFEALNLNRFNPQIVLSSNDNEALVTRYLRV